MAAADIERAAHQAALRVKTMLLEMLAAEQVGTVSVEVSFGDLTPIKRVEQRAKAIRVSRGITTPIEVIEA